MKVIHQLIEHFTATGDLTPEQLEWLGEQGFMPQPRTRPEYEVTGPPYVARFYGWEVINQPERVWLGPCPDCNLLGLVCRDEAFDYLEAEHAEGAAQTLSRNLRMVGRRQYRKTQ